LLYVIIIMILMLVISSQVSMDVELKPWHIIAIAWFQCFSR
jgi:hypothetical protein